MMFVVPRQRRSLGGRPGRLTLNVWATPSRELAAACGESLSCYRWANRSSLALLTTPLSPLFRLASDLRREITKGNWGGVSPDAA